MWGKEWIAVWIAAMLMGMGMGTYMGMGDSDAMVQSQQEEDRMMEEPSW